MDSNLAILIFTVLSISSKTDFWNVLTASIEYPFLENNSAGSIFCALDTF
ncbi:MAG: hypothetical protein LBV17_00700 [Treponema sp.]|nr:hypothetical protein [Treponema sp.]